MKNYEVTLTDSFGQEVVQEYITDTPGGIVQFVKNTRPDCTITEIKTVGLVQRVGQ